MDENSTTESAQKKQSQFGEKKDEQFGEKKGEKQKGGSEGGSCTPRKLYEWRRVKEGIYEKGVMVGKSEPPAMTHDGETTSQLKGKTDAMEIKADRGAMTVEELYKWGNDKLLALKEDTTAEYLWTGEDSEEQSMIVGTS